MQKVTTCPPMPAHKWQPFQRTQFDKNLGSGMRPVSATKTHDGWASSGVSFEDYTRMQIRKPKGANTRQRRLETPSWAMNDLTLRIVLLRWLENVTHLEHFVQPGTYEQRMEAALAEQAAQYKQHSESLTRLCKEYVALKDGPNPDHKRLKALAVQIENLDTRLRFAGRRGLAAAAACVVLYYRCDWNSVQVADALGMKPPHVRKLLWSLNQVVRLIHDPKHNTERVLRTVAKIKRENDNAQTSAGAGSTVGA